MTGRYPEELGIWTNESGLPDAVPTLAGELRGAGWRTLAVVSNFVLREASGLASGFDRYDDEFPQYEAVRKWPERIAADTTDAALAMLDGCAIGADGKCFLWVHYQDPHGPYTPPEALRERYLPGERGREDGERVLPVQPGDVGAGGIPEYQFFEGHQEVAFYRAGYDAEVRYMDEQIGRFLAGLGERGLSDRAAVVFAADHGESLGELDYWFAHGEHLSESLVRVPLLVRLPGLRPARRSDVVSLVDLFGSLLEWATGKPAVAEHRGRNLFDAGSSGAASVPYLATLGGSTVRRFGIVEGDFKLVVSERASGPRGRLYRRGDASDAEIGAQHPEARARLSARIADVRRSLRPLAEAVQQNLSAEDREKLRALGYVNDDD
jgi:arylsulfatase A-like enzyme